MSTSFLSYAFAPTGAPAGHERTLPNRLADVVNVKDFGATGDGQTDDGPALQAAIEAAWGPLSNPNGLNNIFANKNLIIPPGRYVTYQTLLIKGPFCGHMLGAGSGSTSLIYRGPVVDNQWIAPNFPLRNNLVCTNGLKGCRVKGISFVMDVPNAHNHDTCCFNYTWNRNHPDWTGFPALYEPVGGSGCDFIDCRFVGATNGMIVGDWDDQCDTTTWYNCVFENCSIGLRPRNLNAIESAIYGGRFTNCTWGAIFFEAGSCATIAGVTFENNGDAQYGDIICNVGSSALIAGCTSNSPAFCVGVQNSVIVGCRHVSESAGPFVRLGGRSSAHLVGCYSKNGWLEGHINGGTFESSLHVFACQLDNLNWSRPRAAVLEYQLMPPPLTFAQLPWATEGLKVSISDSPTATWGAPVTSGGGNNHVLLRHNAVNWTVMGK